MRTLTSIQKKSYFYNYFPSPNNICHSPLVLVTKRYNYKKKNENVRIRCFNAHFLNNYLYTVMTYHSFVSDRDFIRSYHNIIIILELGEKV